MGYFRREIGNESIVAESAGLGVFREASGTSCLGPHLGRVTVVG